MEMESEICIFSDDGLMLESVLDNRMTSFVIPDGIEVICDYAFVSCSDLRSIVIPDSVTRIGERAFGGCSSLSELSIPRSVMSIGKDCLDGCCSLRLIDVDRENPSYCAVDGILYDKEQMTLLKYPSKREGDSFGIPDTVLRIEDGCFVDTLLRKVSIPNTIKIISAYAFAWSKYLEEVAIPDSVVEISDLAFTGCTSLREIVIPPNVHTIGGYAFSDCHSLEKVEVNEGLVMMEPHCFSFCTRLKSMRISSTVRKIGDCAFDNSTLLSDIYCHIENPSVLELSELSFSKELLSACMLHVPSAAFPLYKDHPIFGKFVKIRAL